MGVLFPSHPLTNFEIQKYYKNEPRFYGVFSRNNLSKKNVTLMNMQTQARIGLLYFVTVMKLFILIVLVLSMFLKKFLKLLGIRR